MSTATYSPPLITQPEGGVFGFIDTPVRRFGAVLMATFIFFAYGRVLDLYVPKLHIPYILSLVALLAAALSGGMPRALLSRVGVFLTALTVWMIVCIPFSFWRGNSLDTLTGKWIKSYTLAILLISLAGTVKDCRRVSSALAFGTVLVSALALHAQGYVRGRLMLDKTALNNPNDLAQVLLMGLPFLVIMTLPGVGFGRRVFGTLAVPFLIYVTLKTASRGALLAIGISGLFVFIKAPMVTKLKLVVLGFVGTLVFVAVLPHDVRSRYMTMFSGAQGGELQTSDTQSAIASATERRFMLIQALRISIHKPLFGAGPGNFSAYAAVDSHESGQRAHWLETHNTYLQWSSECGFLAAILFIASLVFCFRQLSAVVKRYAARPGSKEVARLAGALQFSLLTYMITAFFSSTAYEILYPTLVGLCMAFIFAAEREWQPVA